MTTTQTAPTTASLTIHAIVTETEGCDWIGVVFDRLRVTYPDAHVTVEYGLRTEVRASGPGADEVEGEYATLLAAWWDDLCADSRNPAWD